MASSSEITRIKCGQIYILSDDNLSLICEYCKRDFFDLEVFRTHVSDHFPEIPNFIKFEHCDSDIKSIKQELVDNQDEASSVVECQLSEDESDDADNQPSEIAERETQSCEQSKKRNHRGKPKEILELQPTRENENDNNTNVKVKKTSLRRSTRKTRAEEPVPLDDSTITDLNETIDSNEPNINSAPATPTACNKPKAIRKKGFQCSFCPRIFRQRRDHREHEDIHAGRQPFECPICFKTFSRAQSFNSHKLVHTDDMPYKCSKCDSKFKVQAKLNIHIRESHLTDTDPHRYFPCTLCDIKFVSRSQLTYHRIKKHKRNDTTVYICDYCQRQFPIKKNLFDHMNKHSRSKIFTCQFCNKTFMYRNSKAKHERTQHRDIAF